MNFTADGLIIAFVWFLAIYLQRDDYIDKIRKIKINESFKTKSLLLCKTIIFSLILVDFIRMFNGNWVLMNSIKEVLRLPIISHLIFVAESILIFVYTLELSHVNLSHMAQTDKDKVERIVFGNGLVVLGGYIILLFLKSLIWGRFTYIYSLNGYMNLNIEFALGVILLLAPGLGIIFAGYHYKNSKKALSYTLPITILVLLSHSILVRALVVIELLDGLTTNLHHKFVEEWIEMDDDLLALSTATHCRNGIAKMNGYYLYGFGLTVFLLWTLQMSYLLPSRSPYYNESSVIIALIFVFVVFWLIEVIAHNTGKFGDIFRMLFIPLAIIITVLPFFTDSVTLSTAIMMPGFSSLYHLIHNALGDLTPLFFVSLVILQGAFGYLMYIIIGTGEKIKNFYAILPLTVVLQLIILAILFPLLAVFPPYLISEHATGIIVAVVLVYLGIAIIISGFASKLFSYTKIKWEQKVHNFWKKKVNVYISIILTTVLIGTPLVVEVVTSKINNNGELVATYKIPLEQGDEIHKYLDHGNGLITVLDNYSDIYTKVIRYDLESQNMLWQLNLAYPCGNLHTFGNGQLIFIDEDHSAFVIIDGAAGTKVYEYNPSDIGNYEYFDIQFNERSVLVTEDLRQFIVDAKLGEITLETIGNSFFELMKGTQLALLKNDKIYKYDGEKFIEKQNIEGISKEEYVYYLDDGLVIFNNSGIVKYDAGLTTKELFSHNFFGSRLLGLHDKNDYIYSNKMLFDTSNNNKEYVYMINLDDFESKSVLLEQKIKGFNDLQNISFDNLYENYLLYDQYQLTFYKEDVRVARYWFDNEMDIAFKPVVNGNTVFIIDAEGNVQKISIKI